MLTGKTRDFLNVSGSAAWDGVYLVNIDSRVPTLTGTWQLHGERMASAWQVHSPPIRNRVFGSPIQHCTLTRRNYTRSRLYQLGTAAVSLIRVVAVR